MKTGLSPQLFTFLSFFLLTGSFPFSCLLAPPSAVAADASVIQYKYDALGSITSQKVISGVDTNGDGIPDGVVMGSNFEVADSDRDAIPDYIELLVCTDVYKMDTDGDGIPDGVEDKNRNGLKDSGETDPCDMDTDNDGIPDGVEDINRNGVVNSGEGNPLVANTNVADSDGDGLIDYLENLTCTDVSKGDSDGDGVLDGAEDSNHDGMVNSGERNPCLNEPAVLIPIIQLILD